MTCFIAMKQLFRLMSKTGSQSSAEMSQTPPSSAIPTLLFRMSMRPWRSRVASATRLISASLATSAAIACALPPSCSISAVVSPAASPLRSTQTTFTPSRAKVTAVALPLPQPGPIEPAPITIATLSRKRSPMMSLQSVSRAVRARHARGVAPSGTSGRFLDRV
jgi:hypothetical protein